MGYQTKDFAEGLLSFSPGLEYSELVVHLENAMTQSSFGHEYARLALSAAHNVFDNDELIHQMDEFHRIYHWARSCMAEINPTRLELVETKIKFQKQEFFQPAFCT